MKPNSSGNAPPFERFVRFFNDLLPEQNLQLLFPLASLLLMLGASHFWFRLDLGPAAEAFRLQFGVDRSALDQLTHSIAVWVSLEQELARAIVTFGFLASLVLWVLTVHKPLRKFGRWVVLPVGSVLIGYPIYWIVTAKLRRSFIDAFLRTANIPGSAPYSWAPSFSDGFYFTLAGVIVLVVALVLARRGRLVLPLRFRGEHRGGLPASGTLGDGRDVFRLVIGMAIWGLASSLLWFFAGFFGTHGWSSSQFPAIEWLPALANALAAALIAIFLLRANASRTIGYFLRKQPTREYAFAVILPLVPILLPRIAFEMLGNSHLGGREWAYGVFELLPGPFPGILLVYAIALFEEFALRGYLQNTLEKHFSLKRSIFLTGILWALLPLGWGTAQSLPHNVHTHLPGFGTLALIASQIIYCVPLGWLFARTRSIVPVALAHGTIALFHLGYGYEINLNHPWLYAAELLLWVFLGWYLFTKHPIAEAVVRPGAESGFP
jgi:membrane protease YdiL (CAAX protease family)